MALGGGRSKKHRRLGDQHRDAGDWLSAAAAYRLHLQAHPADQAIYVQLGHALKEQANLPEAMGAYATAAALNADDPDALRHLADALHRLGRLDEALAAYARVQALEPSVEAIDQIAALSISAQNLHARRLDQATTLFSIQDLFAYLKAHVTLSGIQRVQAGITAHAMQDQALNAGFIVTTIDIPDSPLLPGQFWMIDNVVLKRMVDYATGPRVSHEVLRAMIRACEASAVRVMPGAESTIVILGAFWGLQNDVQRYLASKAAGCRIGVYIYDIIPISHPELCDDNLAVEFAFALCEIVGIANFFITISDATRLTLKKFLDDNDARPVPIETVRLAHHLSALTMDGPISAGLMDALGGRPFVAYVSTIEARKNHLFVVNAWRQLIAEGVRVPDLVFVGRRGWKVQPLYDLLAATDNLNGRVHIFHDLSDEDLKHIYADCMFTVFPSLVEGWGLPVGESLYHGRPCVASNVSAIPEVGGDLVDYIDPLNLRDGIAVFRRLIEDTSYRQRRIAEIKAQFAPRTWQSVSAEFVEKIEVMRGREAPMHMARLEEGVVCSLAFSTDSKIDFGDYIRFPWRLMLDPDQFHAPDASGALARAMSVSIRIPTILLQAEKAFAYVLLQIAPWCSSGRLVIDQLGPSPEQKSIPLRSLQRFGAVRIPIAAAQDGSVVLRLRLDGPVPPPPIEGAPAFGILSLAYAREDDRQLRQDIMEGMIFQP